MICPICRAENSDDRTYCYNCGYNKLQEEINKQSDNKPIDNPSINKDNSLMIDPSDDTSIGTLNYVAIVIIGLIVLIALVVVKCIGLF
jgi:ribosomal protein L40E